MGSEWRLVKYSAEQIGVPGMALWSLRDYNRATGPIKPHSHGTIECVLVTAGEKEYYIAGQDEPVQLKRGQALVLPAGTVHHSVCEGINESYALWLDPCANEFLHLSETGIGQLRAQLAEKSCRRLLAGYTMVEAAHRCHAMIERRIGSNDGPLHLAFAIADLLGRILSECPDEDSRTADEALSMVSDYVARHLAERVDVKRMCTALQVSESSLQHKIKYATGESLMDTVLRQKIKASMPMLWQTQSVTQTAAAFGFFDSSHYTKYFKRHTNISPQEWRRQCGTTP